ncbi:MULTISPECIES: histidine triad nucleotide-binding protein [Microvirgula]|uniref:Histidine triad nucleotide-binding protein n=1 Tax=Microvirgula aerodenitrificans TaxID=57480 RepID=A0A2S0P9E8_9NEIS|nr:MULTISPECIES: histidine triad nucleotide-binding protein [Microvirgula]AVY93965.1 histidine triad nucleotide-binding protein [Microvirgula aerodenitrificans]RAS11465.1 histidine triad (HIT) family protein [Microvirgula sp. AG722]
MTDCIFCKIAHGDIPSSKLYEDDDVLAFHDIHPKAPVHFLVIPKRHIDSLFVVDDSDAPLLGKLMVTASKLAREQGLSEGYKTIVHTGEAGGQEVFHLHVHVLGEAA